MGQLEQGRRVPQDQGPHAISMKATSRYKEANPGQPGIKEPLSISQAWYRPR